MKNRLRAYFLTRFTPLFRSLYTSLFDKMIEETILRQGNMLKEAIRDAKQPILVQFSPDSLPMSINIYEMKKDKADTKPIFKVIDGEDGDE